MTNRISVERPCPEAHLQRGPVAAPPAQVLHVPEQGLVEGPVGLLVEVDPAGPKRDVEGGVPGALERVEAPLEELGHGLHLAHLLVHVRQREKAVNVVRVLRDQVGDGVGVVGGRQRFELEKEKRRLRRMSSDTDL
jgi:hypothetical protein